MNRNEEDPETATGMGETSAANMLDTVVADLESVLDRLDGLGLGIAANHVSQGLELVRKHHISLGSGDKS